MIQDTMEDGPSPQRTYRTIEGPDEDNSKNKRKQQQMIYGHHVV